CTRPMLRMRPDIANFGRCLQLVVDSDCRYAGSSQYPFRARAGPDFQPTIPSLTLTATVGELGPNPVRHLAGRGTAMLAARLYGKKATNGGVKCVSYWRAQLSSQLRLDLQGAFTTSKPPTLNRSRARLSNSLGGPIGMD